MAVTSVVAMVDATPVHAAAPPAYKATPAPYVSPDPGARKHLTGGERQELASERTKTSRSYLTANGIEVDAFPGGSMNYKDASGKWEAIDNTLTPSTRKGYSYQNKANSYAAYLPATLASPVTFALGGLELSFTPVGASGTLSTKADTATYTSAWPGVDVLYLAGNDQLNESIRLNNASAPSTYKFRYQLSGGAGPKVLGDGSIAFGDSTGTQKFELLHPYMVDAKGARSDSVTMAIDPASSLVTVVADQNWLSAADRSWPVVIDPSVKQIDPTVASGQDCYISQASPTANFCSSTTTTLNVGWDGTNASRALLQFNIQNNFFPATVDLLGAELDLTEAGYSTNSGVATTVYPMTQAWTSAATWNTSNGSTAWTTAGATYDGARAAYTASSVGPPVGTFPWYVTPLAQSWVDGSINSPANPVGAVNFGGEGTGNLGVVVKTAENVNQVLSFYSSKSAQSANWPVLKITYRPRYGDQPFYTQDTTRLSDTQQLKVNVTTGNEELSASDLNVRGTGLDLALARTYNSTNQEVSDLGVGWTLSTAADVNLNFYPNAANAKAISLSQPSGSQEVFIWDSSNGVWQGPRGFSADLKVPGGGDACSGSAYQVSIRSMYESECFNSGGQLTKRVDKDGNAISFSYGTISTTITTPRNTVTLTLDSVTHFITQITDGVRTVRYHYNASNQLDQFTDANNQIWSYAYYTNTNGNQYLQTVTDPLGHVTSVAADIYSHVSSITQSPQAGTNYTKTYSVYLDGYNGGTADAAGTSSITDANNHTTNYSFTTDYKSRVASATDADGVQQATTYNPAGLVATHTNGASNDANMTQTQYAYDPANNLQCVQSGAQAGAQCAVTNNSYNVPRATVPSFSQNSPATVTDSQGNTITYVYNTQHDLIQATDGRGTASKYAYNLSNGRLQAVAAGYPAASGPLTTMSTPQRIFNQTVAAGSTTTVAVGGQGGVPSNATAALVNVTATGTTAAGYAIVYPAGQSQPATSNLNWAAGQTVANLVEVPLSSSGQLSIFVGSSSAQILVDALGYVAQSWSASGSGWTSGYANVLNPQSRICDTRAGNSTGCTGKTIAAGGTLDIQVTGVGGIPASGVSAVVLNLTTVGSTAGGYLVAYPTGGARPATSNMNWSAGQVISNRVVVPLGTGGKVTVYANVQTDLIADAFAWYADGSGTTAQGDIYAGVTASRLKDTRTSGQTLASGGTLSLQVAGSGAGTGSSIPSMNSSATPDAVELNITAIPVSGSGYLVAYATGKALPSVSDLNYGGGQVAANLDVIVPLGSDGSLQIYNAGGTTDVLIDVQGYYSHGNLTQYVYNASGQLTNVYPQAPLGGQAFTYDSLSRVKSATDGAGHQTCYYYDNLDRTVGISYGVSGACSGTAPTAAACKGTTSCVFYSYDAIGDRTEQDDQLGTTTYSFDWMGRMLSKTLPSQTISYTWDGAGNMLTDTEGGTVTYTYTPANRVKTIQDSRTGKTTTVTYDSVGRRDTLQYPNGVTVAYGYYVGSMVNCVQGRSGSTANACAPSTDNAACPTATPSGAGTLLVSRVYCYQAPNTPATSTAARYQMLDESATKFVYAYDPAGRLTQVQSTPSGSGTTTTSYGYDAVGNLLSKGSTSLTYNGANEISSTGYGFDASGNETQRAGGTQMAYDVRDHMTSITPSGQGALNLTYSGSDQTEMTSLGGTSLSYNLSGISQRTVGSTTTYEVRDPSGQLLSEVTGNSANYIIPDANGSTIGIADSPAGGSAANATAWSYDAFGSVSGQSNKLGTTMLSSPFLFDGAYSDGGVGTGTPQGDVSGLYKIGARFYDPAAGRWTQPDPVVNTPTYRFVEDNPVNRLDKSGLLDWRMVGARCFFGAGIGLAIMSFGDLTVIGALAAAGAGCGAGALASVLDQWGQSNAGSWVEGADWFWDLTDLLNGLSAY